LQTRKEEEYARKFKETGDNKYRDLAVEEMRDLIFSTVRSINLSQSIDTRTLYIKGLGLAAKAVETWDPLRAKLSTHVVNSLHPLKRVVYKEGPTLHTPEHVIKDFGNFKKFFSDYVDQYGDKEIDTIFLSDQTGIPVSRIKEFIKRERSTYNDSTLSSVNVNYMRTDHRIDLDYIEDSFNHKTLHRRIFAEIKKKLKNPRGEAPNAREIHRKIGGSYYEVNKAYKEIVMAINDYLKTIS